MNGRVYDPFLARMVTADPNVPMPFDLQSFNRFSYVNNRPCNFTDPSGFCANGAYASNGIVSAAGNALDSGLNAAAVGGTLPLARAGVFVATVGFRSNTPAGYAMGAVGVALTLPSLVSAYQAGSSAGQAVLDLTNGRQVSGGELGQVAQAGGAANVINQFMRDLFTGRIQSSEALIVRALGAAYEAGRAADGNCRPYQQPLQPSEQSSNPSYPEETAADPGEREGGNYGASGNYGGAVSGAGSYIHIGISLAPVSVSYITVTRPNGIKDRIKCYNRICIGG